MEVTGEVLAVGDGVAEPRPGARVMAVPIFGGHAEKVCLPAAFTQPLPSSLSFEEGAAIAVTGLTADHALFTLGRLRLGERVAITAAAGGVGTMAVQMAASVGARVLAVASTPAKRSLAASLGAQETASYEEYPAALKDGVDLVLDAVGGAVFRPGWKALRPNGRYVVYGFATAAGPRRIRRLEMARMGLVTPFGFVSSCRALLGFNLSLLPSLATELRQRLAALLGLITVGEIKPVIGEVLPFSELPRAHALLQGRRSTGKLVITV
jgi:NADPH:quinone reductase-like Zn-dependent oxidoreductase